MHSPRIILLFTAALSLAVTACDDDAPAPTGPTLPAAYSCDDTADFQVFAPLKSEAFDPDQGGLLIDGPPSYVVHTTQLLTKPETQQEFLDLSTAVFGQLAQTDGLIAVSVGGSTACGWSRTLAIWADEASMYAFVGTGAHATAMARTRDISTSGRVTHWTATADEVNALTWDVARAKISDVAVSALYD